MPKILIQRCDLPFLDLFVPCAFCAFCVFAVYRLTVAHAHRGKFKNNKMVRTRGASKRDDSEKEGEKQKSAPKSNKKDDGAVPGTSGTSGQGQKSPSRPATRASKKKGDGKSDRSYYNWLCSMTHAKDKLEKEELREICERRKLKIVYFVSITQFTPRNVADT